MATTPDLTVTVDVRLVPHPPLTWADDWSTFLVGLHPDAAPFERDDARAAAARLTAVAHMASRLGGPLPSDIDRASALIDRLLAEPEPQSP